MKLSVSKSVVSRRAVVGLFVCLCLGSVLFAWQRTAMLQTKDDSRNARTDAKPPSVRAAGRGNPHLNFRDGIDLIASKNAGNESASAAASADFDSDGVADLVTAGDSGHLRLFLGNDPRRNEAEITKPGNDEKPRKSRDLPFDAGDRAFSLNTSPDFLFAGDFNADGQQDILAAAKSANFLVTLAGDGRGNFSQPNSVAVSGQITALITGEIGRKDGQADVAVAVSNKNGSFLLVFEHPESAFKHKPEIFKLPAPATDLAIGNLDDDFYADVAVASGSDLTVVHGRGQAYPWDLIAESGIKRPAAFVATRRMPFAISALTVGRFGIQRGEILAILGQDGNIYRLEPNRQKRPSNNKLPVGLKAAVSKDLFLPTDTDDRDLATLAAPAISPEESEKLGVPMFDTADLRAGNRDEILQTKMQEAAAKHDKPNQKDIEGMVADGLRKKAENNEKARQSFLRSIAGRPSTLANWELETLVTDSQFSGAAASGVPIKMMRVNISDSNLDDILVIDATANQIKLVSQLKEDQSSRTEITNLDVENGLQAVLPMRLNLDALSDLVVLRKGAGEPSVVMTAPANVFIVTSTDETGDCQSGNPCSLRNAILLSNSAIGMDIIAFDLGAGVHTIAPATQLPVITNAVSLQGSSDSNNNKLVEISGVNIASPSADGLKFRSSNSFIYNLAVNQFPALPNPGGSIVGGNAITLETTLNSPANGNNFVVNNYLGTDPTGSFAKANAASGLNVFDSDDNYIAENVMSGNDSPQTGGVGIAMTAGNSNFFQRNIIGLNSLGTAKLPNRLGVFFTGANNTFGGDGVMDGNTVSGNGSQVNQTQCAGRGLAIATLVDLTTGELLTLNNNVKGNRFGTNPAGTLPLGNCSAGIYTSPLNQTVIGSITENGRNVIGDNGYQALECDEELFFQTAGGFCAIAGNNIGTDITGTIAIPNDGRNTPGGFDRVRGNVDIFHNNTLSYFGAPGGTTPGGACTGFCNLYSGNNEFSPPIYFTGQGTIGFFNNYIGTNRQGTQALPNYEGIFIGNAILGQVLVGAVGQDENNTPISFGNLISGNRYRGITAGTFDSVFTGAGYFSTVSIQGNRIGTDVLGTFAVPNGRPGDISFGSGIYLGRGYTEQTFVGGAHPLARNIISGNAGDGIYSRPSVTGFGLPTPTKIVNNLIGLNSALNPVGNGVNGIEIQDGVGVQIGGTDQEANQIAYNGTLVSNAAGVLINGFGGVYGAGNSTRVRNNLIHDNAGLGIDLNSSFAGNNGGGDGVTPNDCNDIDEGANDLQNFPELLAPMQNGNGTVTVQGVLRSVRRRTFTIDFYANTATDSSNYGEGANPIGSTSVTTDGNGYVEFTFTSMNPVSASLAITATATDTAGNTSEFSCAAGACGGTAKTIEELRALGVSCVEPIVVNIDGDDPDDNPSDGICDIDNADGVVECSLRAAIQEANARDGFNLIKFGIPGGGVHTIVPLNQLPEVNGRTDIDATSQPGYSGLPLIKLDGTALGGSGTGLKVTGNTVTISGFSIVRFQFGISLRNAVGAEVNRCFIGLNADGLTAPSDQMDIGVEVRDGGGANTIGGYNVEDRNFIANNTSGIYLSGGSSGNYVLNNVIGLDASFTNPLPNQFGIVIDGSNGNFVGGELDGESNLIAGNSNTGIVIEGSATQNHVNGNYLGLDPNLPETGTLGNLQFGIVLDDGANNNRIGETDRVHRNVIGYANGAFDSAGVLITAAAGLDNTIGYNDVGVFRSNAGKSFPIANSIGIYLKRGRQTVGNLNQTTGNLIGFNLSSGIIVEAQNTAITKVNIHGNTIGTDGVTDLGNGGSGILLVGDVSQTSIYGNTVSGNSENGLKIDGGHENRVVFNNFGTNFNGDEAIPNDQSGISLYGSNNQIGDQGQNAKNLISGNTGVGLAVLSGSVGNTIRRNFIGTNADGNGFLRNFGGGVILAGSENTIKENLISGNALFGVSIAAGADDPAQQNNRLVANNIGADSDGNNELGNGFGVFVSETARSNSIEKGNLISGNHQDGVFVSAGAVETFIMGNFIGMTLNGQFPLGNSGNGVLIRGSGVLVGGETEADRNVISGNLNGVVIEKTVDSGANDGQLNLITNNFIGLDIDGVGNIPNVNDGVLIYNGANNNVVGYALDGNGNPLEGTENVISGNGANGIRIANDGSGGESTDLNVILGNLIGTSPDTETSNGNSNSGIMISDSPNNLIGTESAEPANVISGNTGNGVLIEGAGSIGNRLTNNYIGITLTGAMLGNGLAGVRVNGAPESVLTNNDIGGNLADGILAENLSLSRPGPRTQINHKSVRSELSGRVKAFLDKSNAAHTQNLTPADFSIRIVGNRIGSDESGENASGNQGNGISMMSSDLATIERNLIVNSGRSGILSQNTLGLSVLGNVIGVIQRNGGTIDRGNLEAALKIVNSADAQIKSVVDDLGNTFDNVFGGSGGPGVEIDGSDSVRNSIKQTFIGTDRNGATSIGNDGGGILITNGARLNTVGGPEAGSGNTIAFNGGPGVRIDETAGHCNLVDPNSIFGNAGLGIDIGGIGHTPNDPGDADSGPNNLQNYPEIVSKQVVNNELIIGFKIDSAPVNSNYGTNGLYVEFFKADLTGEGQRFLGFTYYTTTDFGGSLAGTKTVNLGNINSLGINATDAVTATATDADNNTSEFFPPFAPTAAGVVIGGTVVDKLGRPISRAKVAITEASGASRTLLTGPFGKFEFEGIASGQTVVVSVGHKRFRFDVSEILLTVDDDLNDLRFVGAE